MLAMTIGNIILNFIKEFSSFFLKTKISQGSYSQGEISMLEHLDVLQPGDIQIFKSASPSQNVGRWIIRKTTTSPDALAFLGGSSLHLALS